MASLSAAMNFEHGDGDEEYLLNGNESYATNHRHLQELQRLSAFQQVKVPPSYDGRSSWFAYMKMRSMIGVTSLSLMVTSVDQP